MAATTTLDHRTTPPPVEVANCVLYRDIHKGIRAELFAVTGDAGSIDPTDRLDRAALAAHVARLAHLLESHAAHEDAVIGPVLEVELPDLAGRAEADHAVLEATMESIVEIAGEVVPADPVAARAAAQHLYLELAGFTSAYLAHQDFEERAIMPALWDAIGPEAVAEIDRAIVDAIPPEQKSQSLAFMLPAMNVDDRTELLGGILAGAPPEVFDGAWSLARSVLSPPEHAAVATRLGVRA